MRGASPGFPGLDGLGDPSRLHEQWYSLKNFAKDLHVILKTQGAERVFQSIVQNYQGDEHAAKAEKRIAEAAE